MSLQAEAQQFLFSTHKGILSTHSIKHPEYPYGSVAPFVVDQNGMPTILISTLAEHTKNIAGNAHVSFIAFQSEEDLQANARLTLLAKAAPADKQNTLLRARYLRYLPQAEQYFDMHDFSFYTLNITHARYIAGFGKMGWIAGDAFQIPKNALFEQEQSIIAHMNADHEQNLKDYCAHTYQLDPQTVRMIGIDSLGFDLDADGQQLRFHFEQAIENATQAREALVSLAKTSRQ